MADVKNLTVGTTTYNIVDDGAARTSHSHTLSSPLSNVSIPNVQVSGSSVSSISASLATNSASATDRVPYVSSISNATFYTYPASATTNASVNTASIGLTTASYVTPTTGRYTATSTAGGKFSYTSASQTLTYTDPSWTASTVINSITNRTAVHNGTTATASVVKSFTPTAVTASAAYMSVSATPNTASATWSGSITNQSMTFTDKSIT